MTPEIAVTIFDKCLSALGLIREGKQRRTKKVDEALYALYAALNETTKYIHERNDGKRRDRNREYHLAQLWEKASVPIRHIDGTLAARCFAKGNYWMNPDSWTNVRIRASGITLDEMLSRT